MLSLLYSFRLSINLTASRHTIIYNQTKKASALHSPMGWVSYLHRAATTNYLCCGQALEDSLGAGRIGLTHTFS